MESFPKNQDLEDVLQLDGIKGTHGKRDKAKKIIAHLKAKFSMFDWPSDDSSVRKIMHATEKLRTLQTRKCDIEMNSWRQKMLLSDIVPPPSDEAPPNVVPDVPVVPVVKRPVGRPAGSQKRLSDGTCKKTANKAIDEIVDSIAAKAEFHNYNPFTLLNMINQRCQIKWRKASTAGDKYNVPVPDACAMMYNLNLSTNQYQELRLFLMKFKFEIPPRNLNDVYKKSLLPNITSDTIKTECHIKELVTNTVSSLLVACNWEDPSPTPSTLSITSKFGLDGSGSHNIRHQKANEEDVPGTTSISYIGAFWCPLMLKVKDEVVWDNPLPNSTLYCRPVCLMHGKEERKNIEEHFKPIMDNITSLEEESTPLIRGTIAHDLDVTCEISMVDGKMIDLIHGDSGSFCHYCDVTRDEANNMELIKMGFPLTKTYQQVQERWDKLASGEMAYSNPERKGQCHEPMVKKDLRHFANLHSKLRSLDFCLKLLYHLESGQTHTWSESNARVLQAVTLAKKQIREKISELCGLVLDMPTANGGNTNSGPTADRFFEVKDRVKICSVIRKTKDRENFNILLGFFNKLLSVTQRCDSNMIAIPDRVTQLGTALMVHIKEAFPFAMITPSVHQMAAHSGQLFELTEGKSIAVYAEQGSEAWNKYIRAYKSGPSARARQCSVENNTRDIFTRMMLQTHPLIATKKRQIQCFSCGGIGHSIMTCKARFEIVRTEEESEVWECYL